MCYYISCIGILSLRKLFLRGEEAEFGVSRVKVPTVARRSLAHVGCDRRYFSVIELFRSFPLCNERVAFFAESVDGLFCYAIF